MGLVKHYPGGRREEKSAELERERFNSLQRKGRRGEGCLQGEGMSVVGPHQTLTLGWPEGRKSFGVHISQVSKGKRCFAHGIKIS